MIKINKNTDNIPISLSNESFKKHYIKFIENKVKTSGRYYSAEDVKLNLKSTYKNKCAYCESIENKPDTEHYRPKS